MIDHDDLPTVLRIQVNERGKEFPITFSYFKEHKLMDTLFPHHSAQEHKVEVEDFFYFISTKILNQISLQEWSELTEQIVKFCKEGDNYFLIEDRVIKEHEKR